MQWGRLGLEVAREARDWPQAMRSCRKEAEGRGSGPGFPSPPQPGELLRQGYHAPAVSSRMACRFTELPSAMLKSARAACSLKGLRAILLSANCWLDADIPGASLDHNFCDLILDLGCWVAAMDADA